MPSPLPLLIPDPVRRGPAHLELLLPGAAPITLGGEQPVSDFNPGWRAVSLFTLLDPVLMLVLRHEDGSHAVWYVGRDGRLSFPPAERGEAERRGFAARLDPVALWLRLAPGAPISLPLPPEAAAVLRLPREAREALAQVAGSGEAAAAIVAPATAGLDDARPDGGKVVAVPDGETRRTLIGHPDALVPLTADGRPVELQPGWRIDVVETAAAPILCLPLSRENGERAVWYADPHGRMLSHATGLLPADLGRHLARHLTGFREALWRRFVTGADIPSPDGAPDPDADTPPLPLPPADLAILAGAGGDAGPTRTWPLTEPPPPGTAYVVPTGRGLHALDAELVRRSLHHSSHREMERLLAEGRMVWPSPFDGSPVASDGFCFLLHLDCFAYRFRHDALDASFLVVCTGTHFHNQAIWFPEADLLVALGPHQISNCAAWFRDARALLLGHLLAHVPALSAGAARPVDSVLQQYFGTCAVHIGHYVWQDLAGLAFLLRSAAPHGRLPVLQVFSTGTNQSFFGPEEEIFPVLRGRVHRHSREFDGYVDAFYAANQRVIRYTGITIPGELGPAVLGAADRAPAMRGIVAEAEEWRRDAVAAGRPLVLLGLRVGNRAMADQEEFMGALIRRLAAEFPGCAVVLDGLNDRDDRGDLSPPDGSQNGDVAHELRLAAALAAVASAAGVRFRSNVNRSARVSVAWCARADAFLAPWGAALCKYRWICNTPGMALTSRWNLEHRRDLRIYDAPHALEGSSEMCFNAPETAEDLDPARDAGGFDGRGDFVVAREPVFAEFIGLLRGRLRARET